MSNNKRKHEQNMKADHLKAESK